MSTKKRVRLYRSPRLDLSLRMPTAQHRIRIHSPNELPSFAESPLNPGLASLDSLCLTRPFERNESREKASGEEVSDTRLVRPGVTAEQQR